MAPAADGEQSVPPVPGRRLRRAERRKQILDAATRAFARTGYGATGLDDIAAEAGISRVILYRHFESKADLYRAALDRACTRLVDAVGDDNFTDDSIPALVEAAAEDPDGFRLLFRYAAREPEFRDMTDALTTASRDVTYRQLAKLISDPHWTDWAARLIPTVTTEAVIAWLDAGQPAPDQAAARIAQAVHGVIQAAQAP
ncbi:TetR/AcrR family transcriptional regulator [Streptomyces chiangmaiensis]|uniref:Helix-turn-helix domain-containing protein n=1 Tax=Streptomyces chiangmaiensis TaxID=766497 RepID=A0ABU7FS36_9ACTN|nr:helix-turn-helix domain-containing protein [Streptomyces chiangmaiensis]MED7826735.1 helix-turn-helix domain-containing protein [Streptomyces chiangmaiensis]